MGLVRAANRTALRRPNPLEELELLEGGVQGPLVNQLAGAEDLAQIPLGTDKGLQDIVEGV